MKNNKLKRLAFPVVALASALVAPLASAQVDYSAITTAGTEAATTARDTGVPVIGTIAAISVGIMVGFVIWGIVKKTLMRAS